ncbi:MAG TPA: hypothetical protein V6D12_08425 [Candidatus Obscuribacterales bacterium]
MNKLHRCDRAQEEDRWYCQCMNGKPSNGKNWVGNWLIRSIASHVLQLKKELIT